MDYTFFSIFCGAYCLTLGCYAKQNQFTVGIPATTRNHPELEDLIGFFVNMLVMEVNFEPFQLLKEFFKKSCSEITKIQMHQIPFEKLVKALAIEKDNSRNPIFQIIFNWHEHSNYENSFFSEFDPQANMTTVKYDLEFTITNNKSLMKGYIDFYAKIFHRITLQNFLDCFVNVLNQLAQYKEAILSEKAKIGEIEFLNTSKKQILEKWKGEVKQKCSCEQAIGQLFEAVVEKYPTNTALICGERSFTYNFLNEQANQLAHYLQRNVKNF